jgi:hypothetical protein
MLFRAPARRSWVAAVSTSFTGPVTSSRIRAVLSPARTVRLLVTRLRPVSFPFFTLVVVTEQEGPGSEPGAPASPTSTQRTEPGGVMRPV